MAIVRLKVRPCVSTRTIYTPVENEDASMLCSFDEAANMHCPVSVKTLTLHKGDSIPLTSIILVELENQMLISVEVFFFSDTETTGSVVFKRSTGTHVPLR